MCYLIAACQEYNLTEGYARVSCSNYSVGAKCDLGCASGYTGTAIDPVCLSNKTWTAASGCFKHDNVDDSDDESSSSGSVVVYIVTGISVIGVGVGAAVLIMTGRGAQYWTVAKTFAVDKYYSFKNTSQKTSADAVALETLETNSTPTINELAIETVETD